jgi:hypothetical protein
MIKTELNAMTARPSRIQDSNTVTDVLRPMEPRLHTL